MSPASRATDSGESEPWQAFRRPSVPNLARRLHGNLTLASAELVGPTSERHAAMAHGRESTSARAGPDVMNSTSGS